MFQHVRCRLKGRLTNRVHADRIPAVATYHKSAADNPSGRCVHALSLRFNGGLRWALGQQPQTLVTASESIFHKSIFGTSGYERKPLSDVAHMPGRVTLDNLGSYRHAVGGADNVHHNRRNGRSSNSDA
jgi:hypothetical protein